MNTVTPPSVTREVLNLCDSIVKGSEPYFVGVSPADDSVINECYDNVRRYINTSGGSMRSGWSIWFWPNIMVEAEAHAIWVSPQGKECDITPNNQLKYYFYQIQESIT